MNIGGVLLCGGSGTRLLPTTKYLNKHLMPIYDKPMVYYSLSILLLSGIRNITIVTNPNETKIFKKLLGNGEEFGVKISYSEQEAPKGIPDAINNALETNSYEKFMVVLGDNFIFGEKFFTKVEDVIKTKKSSIIFSQKVKMPENFGVLSLDIDGNVKDIVEKPTNFVSDKAVVGIYVFDKKFKEYFGNLTVSTRGEYEITDIVKEYGYEDLKHMPIGRGTAWFDMGSTDDFNSCSSFVKTIQERQGLLVCSPHEIALRNNWISKESFLNYLNSIKNSEYADNLSKLLEEF